MSSASPSAYSLSSIPRPGHVKVAPPGTTSVSVSRKPIGNPRLQAHHAPPSTSASQPLPTATASRTQDLSSIMSGLSLAQSRPAQPPLQSRAQSPKPSSSTTMATARARDHSSLHDDDDDDDDIQILPTSTSVRPASSSYHSPSETKAALRALTKLVSSFTGPLSMTQVDAIQSILYPPTRPTEAMSVTDDVLSELAHITAFPGTRLARAAEQTDNLEDDPIPPDHVLGADPASLPARPVKPGDALAKVGPGRSLAHRALALKLAEHRKRKEEERNGNSGEAVGSAATPACQSAANTPLRPGRVPGTPAATAVAGTPMTAPLTDVKPSLIKREPVDTLDRVLLEVSVKTKAAIGGSSKVVGLGAETRLGGMGSGGLQSQQPGKRRLVKPVQPPTL